MTSESPAPQPDAAAGTLPLWSDAPSRDALQLIAEGVTELAGFGIAAICVVRDDGKLEVMAVAGSDEARASSCRAAHPDRPADGGDRQGRRVGPAALRAARAARPSTSARPGAGSPTCSRSTGPDAWHPLDLLIALLHDDEGQLRGTMSIDLPTDGRRPGEAQRAVLQKYAEQAGRAVVTALEREKLAAQVRLAEAARKIVRSASAQRSAWSGSSPTAARPWPRASARPACGSRPSTRTAWAPARSTPPTAARSAARATWSRSPSGPPAGPGTLQPVEIVSHGRPFGPTVDEAESDRILAFLDVPRHRLDPVRPARRRARVPRQPGAHPARAVHRSGPTSEADHRPRHRPRPRPRDPQRPRLRARAPAGPGAAGARHLQEPADRDRLARAEEPAHLDRAATSRCSESVRRRRPRSARSLAAMDRGSQRLLRVVEDLLLLSKVGDPHNPVIAAPVDLHRILDDAVDLTVDRRRSASTCSVAGRRPGRRGARQRRRRRARPGLRQPGQQRREVHPRGRLHPPLRATAPTPRSVLTCRDEGIGISAADQALLFTEFFRSSNPEAVAQPGTGLGLTIVQRIVERHGGRIEVDSDPRRGQHLPGLPPRRPPLTSRRRWATPARRVGADAASRGRHRPIFADSAHMACSPCLIASRMRV